MHYNTVSNQIKEYNSSEIERNANQVLMKSICLKSMISPPYYMCAFHSCVSCKKKCIYVCYKNIFEMLKNPRKRQGHAKLRKWLVKNMDMP